VALPRLHVFGIHHGVATTVIDGYMCGTQVSSIQRAQKKPFLFNIYFRGIGRGGML
jgi:hypothetical protein